MKYGRRASDFPQQKLVTGIFYYCALSVLLFCFGLSAYWQLQDDNASFELIEMEFTSTPAERSFFVPVVFCSAELKEFTLIRYYHDIGRNVYYAVPDGKYKTSNNGCFDTRVSAHTGRLEQGDYEYHISVSYELNPLRTIQRKVAIVRVTIE